MKMQDLKNMYEEIWSREEETIYYHKEDELFFVEGDNGDNGAVKNIAECFEYLYKGRDANEIFDICEEKYFKFDFTDMDIIEVDNEVKICIRLAVDFTYDERFFLTLDKKTYEEYPQEVENGEKVFCLRETELSFNCAYVGSADGIDVFWVKKEIVEEELGESYSFDEFVEAFSDSENQERSKYAFMTRSQLDDYLVKYGDGFLKESDFTCICESKYLA